MLENIPAGVGRALSRVRGDLSSLVCADSAFAAVPDVIQLTSPAFAPGGPMPPLYTEDGEGVSPPLEWIGVPPEAESLVLLIEDVDSPTPKPLVHAILADLQPSDGLLPQGALPSPDNEGFDLGVGRNSYLRRAYLPPDPPRGHGPHRYAFQMFALDHAPNFGSAPGRRALVDAIRGHAIARGLLIGTYERS